MLTYFFNILYHFLISPMHYCWYRTDTNSFSLPISYTMLEYGINLIHAPWVRHTLAVWEKNILKFQNQLISGKWSIILIKYLMQGNLTVNIAIMMMMMMMIIIIIAQTTIIIMSTLIQMLQLRPTLIVIYPFIWQAISHSICTVAYVLW